MQIMQTGICKFKNVFKAHHLNILPKYVPMLKKYIENNTRETPRKTKGMLHSNNKTLTDVHWKV